MHILLDECLPKNLAEELPGHYVRTVPQAGWAGISNGKLLSLIAASANFEVFVTVDKNLPQQNKIKTLPLSAIVLRAKSNRFSHLQAFAPEILRWLPGLKPGQVYVLTQP